MTEFEVKRIEQVFSVLEDLKIKEYKEKATNSENRKYYASEARRYLAVLNEVKSLLSRYGLLEAGRTITEEQLNDPTDKHMYRFRVQYKARSDEECGDWDFDERRLQEGCNVEDAKKYLESHLLFEHCTDKTFRDLKIELIDQFF